jgi:hypothetical protein
VSRLGEPALHDTLVRRGLARRAYYGIGLNSANGAVDFECLVAHAYVVGADEVNRILMREAATEGDTGVLGVSHDPVVSSAVISNPRASAIGGDLTRGIGEDPVTVMGW